ncbi:unnamed protein product, partial [Phaeothamnion confervicola]
MEYFEQAKQSIIDAINSANGEQTSDKSITELLPERVLGYFDRLGRALRTDEAIEFAPSRPQGRARLTRESRIKLLLASSVTQGYVEEGVWLGTIPQIDQTKMSFGIKLDDSSLVTPALMSEDQQETILEATAGFRVGTTVWIRGLGKYDREGQLKSIESIEQIRLIEEGDIVFRLKEFKTLKDGWLDGVGVAPRQEGLDWLAQRLLKTYPQSLPIPYIYPTPEAGVQLEWRFPNHEASLSVDLQKRVGEWQDLTMDTQADVYKELDLNTTDSWVLLLEEIRSLSG